jgi:arylsulfatase A-like enzyme
MPTPRPNLLVIMTDHQRADSLGMVQAGVEVCPNLNRLAARSWRTDRCYTASPICVPARTALATGRYPCETGIVCNAFDVADRTDSPTLQRHLADAGYELAHVGIDHPKVDPPMREQADWSLWCGQGEYDAARRAAGVDGWPDDWPEAYRDTVDEWIDGEPHRRNYSNTRVGRWSADASWFKDAWWCEQAAAWWEQAAASSAADFRGAMFLNLWAPHPPLVLPEPYASMFDPDAIDLPANVGQPAADEPADRRRAPAAQLADGVDEAAWRRVWAAHLGLVRLADDGIGRVLDALERAGVTDDTVVVFTSDHGEHLGQHRLYQKMEMYEPAVNVPLLIAGPDIPAGHHQHLVSHVDLTPTLAQLAGAATHGMTEPGFADALRAGGGPASGGRDAVVSQFSGNHRPGDLRRAWIGPRFKYVWSPAGPELLDLETDPLETRNLADDPRHAGTLRQMHDRLVRWAELHGDTLMLEQLVV